jgi:hypothetical protein
MTSWFFIEMAAKSALICSIALLLAMALKHRAAPTAPPCCASAPALLLALPLIDLASRCWRSRRSPPPPRPHWRR